MKSQIYKVSTVSGRGVGEALHSREVKLYESWVIAAFLISILAWDNGTVQDLWEQLQLIWCQDVEEFDAKYTHMKGKWDKYFCRRTTAYFYLTAQHPGIPIQCFIDFR